VDGDYTGNYTTATIVTSGTAATASIDVIRQANNISYTWNGTPFFSQSDSDPLSKIEVSFWYFGLYGPPSWPYSWFGTESVDVIQVDGVRQCVPEPATMLLLGLGLIGLAGVRRKFKN
jgi:hypothetical protein